jgi:peroxiredoxin
MFRMPILRWFTGGNKMATLGSGSKAPEFALKTTDDKNATLGAALKKGPALVAFFKVNCPTCQCTFPFLERIHEATRNSGLTIWGISQNDAKATLSFCREYGVTFPVLVDDGKYTASNAYGLSIVPSLFWINAEGKIEKTSVGFVKSDLEAIAAKAAQAANTAAFPVFRRGEQIPDIKPG